MKKRLESRLDIRERELLIGRKDRVDWKLKRQTGIWWKKVEIDKKNPEN